MSLDSSRIHEGTAVDTVAASICVGMRRAHSGE